MNEINIKLTTKKIEVETKEIKCKVTREMVNDLKHINPYYEEIYQKEIRIKKLKKILND